MTTEALFSIPHTAVVKTVTIIIDGKSLTVPDGISVAAALLAGGVRDFRSTVVGKAPRAPYCMMGVCFECLIEIDGVPARQSCLVPVRDGMRIRRQDGAADLVTANLGDVA
ncbi:(2Fe-2S)-binding protein [Azospirillum picis]|uniref:Molibdopterin-dependent oxidoreductase YjgC n=1 Tax=Azospirillum picis TaxID=488438 RepID=A0ABU0MMD7_9PROT|nr:(2Fe-2S)-binding protein [Azospirillum picis]MBP2300669.1 putative molibdopterin-dependent oxidoreductase YjgC [Azospirillum picis]MDQ0534638.1 putative molibdopterin-dependent oxidoreductase YjgC [Azospirillum picis]